MKAKLLLCHGKKEIQGLVVKWYYAAFALRRHEFDSRRVHKR